MIEDESQHSHRVNGLTDREGGGGGGGGRERCPWYKSVLYGALSAPFLSLSFIFSFTLFLPQLLIMLAVNQINKQLQSNVPPMYCQAPNEVKIKPLYAHTPLSCSYLNQYLQIYFSCPFTLKSTERHIHFCVALHSGLCTN